MTTAQDLLTTPSVPMTPITLDHRGHRVRGWEYGTVRPGAAAVLLVHGFGDSDTGARQLFVQTARTLVGRGVGVRAYRDQGPTYPIYVVPEFAHITLFEHVGQDDETVIDTAPADLPEGFADRSN